MSNLQSVAKNEYQRRELYNVFYALMENTQDAWQIMRTCKPCKKKAQEAGLSTDEVDAEKMDLLIKGYQCFINEIDKAKKQVDELGYPADDTFDLNAYKDACMAYFEAENEKHMKEHEMQMTEPKHMEFSKKVDEIIAYYNELMNKEIQKVKKEMGV